VCSVIWKIVLKEKLPSLISKLLERRQEMKYLLILGVVLVALGILVSVTPWYIFPVCEMHGMYAITSAGTKLLMPCGYTARVETGVAAPLLILAGAILPLSKTKESRRAIGIFSFGLGALVLLLPTYITGICANQEHPCRVGTLPALVLLGSATITISIIAIAKR
jgi:hypothetical protein